jgi:pimeloyl-ACP methyl ester carboxylesterase
VLDNATNTTQEQYIPIKGPFVMMGVSAGTLYTRQFANNYPADTAGMILIDPAPTANGGLQTAQQRYLDPFTMTLCTRFLQPTGVIRALYPALVEGLFAAKTKFEMNGAFLFSVPKRALLAMIRKTVHPPPI